jgi:hypothetical protein
LIDSSLQGWVLEESDRVSKWGDEGYQRDEERDGYVGFMRENEG